MSPWRLGRENDFAGEDQQPDVNDVAFLSSEIMLVVNPKGLGKNNIRIGGKPAVAK
jgi:hypothetical protein